MRRKKQTPVEVEEQSGIARPGSKEWGVAWQGLVDFTGDEDRMAVDPESGEVWQYLGSTKRPDGWEHSFRHRWHPRLRRRWVLWVPASKGWSPPARDLWPRLG